MKTIITLTLTAILFSAAKSQESEPLNLKGKFELSPAFSFQYMQGSYIISVPMRLNYFLTNYLSIGADASTTLGFDMDRPGIIISALLETDFPSLKKVIPFLTAGYGFSNGSLPFDKMAVQYYETNKLGVLNLGAGIKIPISHKVLVRTDIRYQHFSGQEAETYEYEEYDSKIQVGTLNVNFGFCFLL